MSKGELLRHNYSLWNFIIANYLLSTSRNKYNDLSPNCGQPVAKVMLYSGKKETNMYPKNIQQAYKKFERDPQTQWNYHRKMSWFWLLNFVPMNIIVGIDVLATIGYFPIRWALLTNAILLAVNTNYSLYANFDTEVGDAHAAYASIVADQIQHNQNEPHTALIFET